MTHNCTPNDLLRFIYQETSPEENSNIKKWLLANDAASELYMELAESKRLLEKDEMNPSESSISIILDFSRENAHEESHV